MLFKRLSTSSADSVKVALGFRDNNNSTTMMIMSTTEDAVATTTTAMAAYDILLTVAAHQTDSKSGRNLQRCACVAV